MTETGSNINLLGNSLVIVLFYLEVITFLTKVKPEPFLEFLQKGYFFLNIEENGIVH